MKHLLNMSSEEKVIAWFELCDFTFSLMRETLGPEKMNHRMRKIRERRQREKEILLSKIARSGDD